jgi:hypothetical protein
MQQRQTASFQSTVKLARVQPPQAKAAPKPIEEALLKQIAGGVTTNAPHGTW